MSKMATPCALFSSCTNLDPLEIVKQIIVGDGDSSTFPVGIPLMEDIKAYPWHVDTKYYTADINLCTTQKRTIGDKQFADSVQAAVIHFDTTEESSFELLKAWLPYLKEIEPAVQIVVCNRCSIDDVIPRRKTLEWCIENEFELVELNPIEEDSDSEECDFMETTGVKRIIQALHAHTWPNLEMKERPSFRSPMITQLMREEAQAQAENSSNPLENSSNPLENSSNSPDNLENQSTEDITDIIPTTDPSEAPDNSQEPTAGQGAGTGQGAEGGSSAEGACACPTESSDSIDVGKAKKEQKKKSNQEIADQQIPSEDLRMLSALGDEDPGGEAFELMFERLRDMKEKAESLPLEERKAYAEKVAIEFWKSIGGDADEISGLSDSD